MYRWTGERIAPEYCHRYSQVLPELAGSVRGGGQGFRR